MKKTTFIASLTLSLFALASHAETFVSGNYSGPALMSMSSKRMRDEPCKMSLEFSDQGKRVFFKNMKIECPKASYRDQSAQDKVFAGDLETKEFGAYDVATGKIAKMQTQATITKFERVQNTINLEIVAMVAPEEGAELVKVTSNVSVTQVKPGNLKIEASANTPIAAGGLLILGKISGNLSKK